MFGQSPYIQVVGKSYFGTDRIAMAFSEVEQECIRRHANRMLVSRKVWDSLLPDMPAVDRYLYEVLFEREYPKQPTMQNVFHVGDCHRNSYFAAWILNGRTLKSTKYEICHTPMHSALQQVHTFKILDPTYEAHPEATMTDDWKSSAIASLLYECLEKGSQQMGFPVNSLEEIKNMDPIGPLKAFLEQAERISG